VTVTSKRAALLPSGGKRSFYMVDPLIGPAAVVGTFPSFAPVTAVAVALDPS
jgi:hypothetical protein